MKRQKTFILIALITLNFLTSWGTTFAQEKPSPQKPPLIPIETFSHLPNATNVKISPTGKWLSMIREIEGVYHIYIQKSSNAKDYILIPPSKNLEISWYEWVSEDWVVFSLTLDDHVGNTDVLRTILGSYDVANNKMKWIIKPSKKADPTNKFAKYPPPQVQDKLINILKDDPYHILVAIDGDWDGEHEIRKIDIRNGNFKIFYPDRRGIQHWVMDHLGNLRMGSGFDTYKQKYFYFVPGTKKVTIYDKYAAKEKNMIPIGYTDDLDVVIMRQSFSDRTSIILSYNMKTNAIVEELYNDEEYSPNGVISEPIMGKGINNRPIGISYTKDNTKTLIFDDQWKSLYNSVNKALPKTSNYIVSSSDDKSILIINASNDQDPGVFYMWDRPKKEFFELAIAQPAINPSHMAPMQRIDYKARDGLNIPAYLSTPVGVEAKNLPLVVMPHGGPNVRDYKTYDPFTQFLANRGYAVLQPNFRGSSGFRADFENSASRRWGLEMQDDITDGVNHLIDQGIVDAKRVCIIGFSYGGYAALMGTVKTPDLYKCAASVNGVTHLLGIIAYDKKFIGGNIISKSIANDDTSRSQLIDTSPAEQAHRIKTPILLIQYEDDRVVPKSQAKAMRSALKSAKKKFTYKEFKHGGHSMLSQQARIEVMTELEKFLAEHLK